MQLPVALARINVLSFLSSCKVCVFTSFLLSYVCRRKRIHYEREEWALVEKKKNITSAKLQMVVSKSHLGGRCCSLRTFSRELLFIHHMAKLKSGQTQWKNWKSGNRGIQPCSTFPKNFLPILSFVCKSASTVSTSWGISQIANSCFTQIVEHFYNRGNKRILPFTKSQGTFLFRVYTPTYFLEKFQASYKVILNIEQDN